jgi:hypothetical protein
VQDVVDLMADPAKMAAGFSTSPADILGQHLRAAASADPAGVRALLAGRRSLAGLASYIADAAAVDDPSRRASARRRSQEIKAAWGERVPSEGGFLLTEDWTQALLAYAVEESIMMSRAVLLESTQAVLPIPTISESSHVSSVFGVVGRWVTAGSALTVDTGSFGRERLEAKKLIAELQAPAELVADPRAWPIWLERALPAAVGFYADQTFVNGSGVFQPLGMLNSPAAIKVTRAGGGGTQTVALADLAAMQARLLTTSEKTAIWACSPDVFTALAEIFLGVGATPSGVASPSKLLHFDAALGCWTLYGRPLFRTEHSPAFGSTGDLALIDPAEYVIMARTQGVEVDVSTQHSFGTDVVDIRVKWRGDGRPWRSQALTPANSSATLSSTVVLV